MLTPKAHISRSCIQEQEAGTLISMHVYKMYGICQLGLLSGLDGAEDSISKCKWRIWQCITASRGHMVP